MGEACDPDRPGAVGSGDRSAVASGRMRHAMAHAMGQWTGVRARRLVARAPPVPTPVPQKVGFFTQTINLTI